MSGLGIALVAAAAFAWVALCILFWQGSWQLLYHPTSAVTRTPASVGLDFESIGFDPSPAGEPQLRGWWVPAQSEARFTAIYFHGQNGHLADTVDALRLLHAGGLNVFAFDFRGYGQSRFVHPSESNWRDDAERAIRYLTGTRHIPANAIILVGKDLGANLALEVGTAHPELAGIVVDQPLASPTNVIFSDARAHLVPARLLVSDRWDTASAASNLLIPSLWFYEAKAKDSEEAPSLLGAYEKVPARKRLVWLGSPAEEQRKSAIAAWLDDLPRSRR